MLLFNRSFMTHEYKTCPVVVFLLFFSVIFKVPFNWSAWAFRRTRKKTSSCSFSLNAFVLFFFSLKHEKMKKNWLLLHKSFDYINTNQPTNSFQLNLWCNKSLAKYVSTFLNEACLFAAQSTQYFSEWNEANLSPTLSTHHSTPTTGWTTV